MEDDPRWPPLAQRRARKVKVLRHYKFYLAFENFSVQDYVSEKVFESLFAGAGECNMCGCMCVHAPIPLS